MTKHSPGAQGRGNSMCKDTKGTKTRGTGERVQANLTHTVSVKYRILKNYSLKKVKNILLIISILIF